MNIDYDMENQISIKVNKSIATLYNEIEYSIHFENKFNFDMYDLDIPIRIPENTRYKDNSLYINGNRQCLNIEKIYKVQRLKSNDILDIKYRVCLERVPIDGALLNWASLTYLKKTENEGRQEIKSTMILTTVKDVNLEIKKKLNKEIIKVNDLISEYITIKNVGNINALNIVFQEVIPENILIQDIYINDVKMKNTLDNKGYAIGTLEPFNSIDIRVDGLVIGVSEKIEEFKTYLQYSYFDDYTDKYIFNNIIKNNISLDIKEGYIDTEFSNKISLSLTKEFVFINESVDLDFSAINNGNINVESMQIKLYVTDHIKVNNIYVNKKLFELKKTDDFYKFDLNKLLINERINISGNLEITDINLGEEKIYVVIDYQYFSDKEKKYIKNTFISNEKNIKTYGVILKDKNNRDITKQTDKKVCKIGDTINNKITIKNIGNIICKNITIKEEYEDDEVKFMNNSFIINNKLLTMKDIKAGINIGDLDVNEELEIQYKLKVISNKNSDWILTNTFLEFIEEKPEMINRTQKIKFPQSKIKILYPRLEDRSLTSKLKNYSKDDILTYELYLNNIGNVVVEDVTLELIKEKELILQGILINNESINIDDGSAMMNNKLNIGILKVGEAVSIKILMMINDSEIKNIYGIMGRVLYYYKNLDTGTKEPNILNVKKEEYRIVYGDFRCQITTKDNAYIKGDEINGEIYIENIGNIDLYNVEITQCEKDTIKFLEPKITDKYNVCNLIRSKENLVIPIKLKEDNLYERNVLKLSPKVTAKYNKSEKEIVISKKVDEINIELINEGIKCEIYSNKKRYILDDKAEFKFIISNLGSHCIEDVVLQGIIPNDILITDEKIKRDNKIYKILDISSGIYIGKLDIRDVIVIEYSAIIKNLNSNKEIFTRYKVEGCYNLQHNKKKIKKEYYSETLINNIDKVSALVFFSTDKDILLNGQDIKYKSTIINDGTIPIEIKYKLNIGEELEEVTKFTKLNEEVVNDFDNHILIEPNDGIVIEKRYVYTKFKGMNSVLAQGIIEINYRTEDGILSEYKNIKTDKIKTKITNTTFKEIIVEEKILKDKIQPSIGKIINIYVTPTIIKKYIREIKRNSDYVGIDIIGYKLEFWLKVNYVVEYESFENNNEICVFSKEKIYTASIVLPNSYLKGEVIEIIPKVMDISKKVMENKNIFIILNVLINTSL